MKKIIMLVFMLVAGFSLIFGQTGGELETEVRFYDDEVSNISSFMVWKLFDTGSNSDFELSLMLESDTLQDRLTASPGAILLLSEGVIRLGSEFYLDYFAEDEDVETSQSFWLGLYGRGEQLKGNLRGKVWTNFDSSVEYYAEAQGEVELREDNIVATIGQGLDWSHYVNNDLDYESDTISAETSFAVSYVTYLNPFIAATMQHQWFQSEHETNDWTHEWTYSNSLLLETGINPDSHKFTLTLFAEVPLFSEIEDADDNPTFGLRVKAELF